MRLDPLELAGRRWGRKRGQGIRVVRSGSALGSLGLGDEVLGQPSLPGRGDVGVVHDRLWLVARLGDALIDLLGDAQPRLLQLGHLVLGHLGRQAGHVQVEPSLGVEEKVGLAVVAHVVAAAVLTLLGRVRDGALEGPARVRDVLPAARGDGLLAARQDPGPDSLFDKVLFPL